MSEPNTDADVPLSEAGERRRRAILALALNEAHGRHRRRRRRARGVGALAAVASIAALAAATLFHDRPVHEPPVITDRTPAPADVPPPAPPAPSGGREITIARIPTDPTLARRLAVHPQPNGWRYITDDELLDALGRAGKPAALAYDNGQLNLLFRTPAAH